jgi:hypothetical protein
MILAAQMEKGMSIGYRRELLLIERKPFVFQPNSKEPGTQRNLRDVLPTREPPLHSQTVTTERYFPKGDFLPLVD